MLADITTNTRREKAAPSISLIAFEAAKRIDLLFDMERDINGMPSEQRLAARAERSVARPRTGNVAAWALAPLTGRPGDQLHTQVLGRVHPLPR